MRETISSVSSIIVMISMLTFFVSIIWCIVRTFRRKKINPSLILSVSSIGVFVLFTMIGTIAWSGTEEYEIAMAERKQKEIEQEKLDKKKEALEKKEAEKKNRVTEQDASEESGKTEESQKEKEIEEEIKLEEPKKPEAENEDTIEENKTEKSEDKFLIDFKSVTNEKIANGAYDVLKNQIGFLEVEFKEQLGDTSNYEITGDGTYMVITAMEGCYRVFIPDTSYIFYEDGKVIMTAEEFGNMMISNDDAIIYYIIAQDIVCQNLKNSNSANFPSINFSSQDIFMKKIDDIITVQSYVDAKNSFNIKVRSNWTVQFIITDKDSFSYELKYINIDGQSSGTYTE